MFQTGRAAEATEQPTEENGKTLIQEEVQKYGEDKGCLDMRFVTAFSMSDKPFAHFDYDGIMGLGLKTLSTANEFNLLESGAPGGAWNVDDNRMKMFGVFLAVSSKEDSQITLGMWTT